jgi:hypothetical protein
LFKMMWLYSSKDIITTIICFILTRKSRNWTEELNNNANTKCYLFVLIIHVMIFLNRQKMCCCNGNLTLWSSGPEVMHNIQWFINHFSLRDLFLTK